MKIAVIHDYADALRRTRAYDKLKGHEVVVHTDAYTDHIGQHNGEAADTRLKGGAGTACMRT